MPRISPECSCNNCQKKELKKQNCKLDKNYKKCRCGHGEIKKSDFSGSMEYPASTGHTEKSYIGTSECFVIESSEATNLNGIEVGIPGRPEIISYIGIGTIINGDCIEARYCIDIPKTNNLTGPNIDKPKLASFEIEISPDLMPINGFIEGKCYGSVNSSGFVQLNQSFFPINAIIVGAGSNLKIILITPVYNKISGTSIINSTNTDDSISVCTIVKYSRVAPVF